MPSSQASVHEQSIPHLATPSSARSPAPRRRSRSTPRLALIGCGAIAGSFHLRALRRRPEILERLVLVDPDIDRARALAGDLEVGGFAASHHELLGEIDGAIIAAPHRYHYPIALECLESGVHVLCEKPLSESPAEVRRLVQAAAGSGVVCAVNNTRRLVPSFARVKQLLSEGAIGEPLRMVIREGDRYDWPVSGPVFGRASGGKGVLLDIGAHVLDLVCWWLGGTPRLLDYEDDSLGGSEAAAAITLSSGGCVADIRLSWLAKLSNTYSIQGREGRIELGIYDWRTLDLVPDSGKLRKISVETPVRQFEELAYVLYDDFLDAIRTGRDPVVAASDVLPSISLIAECYSRRRPFAMPWMSDSRNVGVGS